MAFQNRNGIVQRKTHRHRKKGEKHQNIFKELFHSPAVNGFVCKPITDKKDKGANDEKTHHKKIHF